MAREDFLLLVRGAGDIRYFRFHGAEAAELHRLLEGGQLERPPGMARLAELIADRSPESVAPGASGTIGDPDFDMVDDHELRQWLSRRLVERRALRENAEAAPDF